jgi:hypothetical protein
MEINSLAALVSQQSSDLELYAGFVFAALDGALPAGYLIVERHGSMSDRMRGKEATVIGVSVRLGQDTYSLRRVGGGPGIESMIFHEVHGIVLSRQAVPLAQWSLALAQALQDVAETNQAAAAALSRLTGFNV